MIDRFIDRLLVREGGYVDHPADRGGPTNYGITQGTLTDWRGEPVGAAEVQDLTAEEARGIYRDRYWTGPGFDRLVDLPPLITEFLFDTGVHSGPRTAIRMLQRAAGVTDDGLLGPVTRAAVSRTTPRRLAARLITHRGVFLGELIGRDPTQEAFRDGWANRLAEFIERTSTSEVA
ncbi:MAG: glycosyl hydrolase 108 family protein [Xanthomonadales bacterium]|nr:glycosyl hydrolase 108 family protein [Xanthomonadales bacterium]